MTATPTILLLPKRKQLRQSTRLARASFASADCLPEDIVVLAVIVPEAEFGDAQQQMLLADLVESANNAALNQRPKTSKSGIIAVTNLLLRGDEYRERKSPLNKLVTHGVQFACTLAPAEVLFPPFANRKQRRSGNAPAQQQTPHKLGSSDCIPGVLRTVETGQLSLIVQNVARFPLSVQLWSAETEVATLKPPRSNFPKKASTLSPGAIFQIADDIIDMENIPAGRLAGKIQMLIKYGLPGKEIYELKVNGVVDIVMEDFGLVKQVGVAWQN